MRYKGIKGKAWEAVKKWCRANYKDCYTCPATNLVSYNAQAGHCFPVGYVGSNNTLSWDKRQIRLQCGHCNGAGQGMQAVFKANLIKEYGEEVVAELEARQRRVDPIKDWQAIIDSYSLDNMVAL